MKERFFPSRTVRWVKDTFRTGQYGPVLRDVGGWLVSETAIEAYQAEHTVGTPARTYNVGNLRQFQKSSRL